VDFLTVREIADEMRVSRMAVYRWLHDGDLPYYQMGRTIRIARVDYDAYRETMKRGANGHHPSKPLGEET
jgi:excisionase family DNA binding protein